jgi:hypothetical protein
MAVIKYQTGSIRWNYLPINMDFFLVFNFRKYCVPKFYLILLFIIFSGLSFAGLPDLCSAQPLVEPDSVPASERSYLLFIGRAQDSVSNKLCDYLWEKLTQRDFDDVIDTCSKIAFSYTDNACIAGNLAHAYLLTNQYEKAETIYLALPDFRKEILADFDELKALGIWHHDIDRIIAVFQSLKKTEETK